MLYKEGFHRNIKGPQIRMTLRKSLCLVSSCPPPCGILPENVLQMSVVPHARRPISHFCHSEWVRELSGSLTVIQKAAQKVKNWNKMWKWCIWSQHGSCVYPFRTDWAVCCERLRSCICEVCRPVSLLAGKSDSWHCGLLRQFSVCSTGKGASYRGSPKGGPSAVT